MGWFQRYGIPGVYFWGLLIIWTGSFWHCNFDTIQENTMKIVGGIIAISFAPVGYLLSVITQIKYLSGEGIDTRARKEMKGEFKCNSNCEWKQEVDSIIQIMKLHSDKAKGSKFLLDWMAKRVDVVVISRSLMWASGLGFLSSLLIPWIIGWDSQFSLRWFLFATTLTAFVICVSYWIVRILERQLVEVEKEMFKYMGNEEAR